MADEKGDHEDQAVVGRIAANLNNGDDTNGIDHEHDPHFEPIVSLPEVPVSTMEDDEVEMIKLRAKLFRYDTQETPPEWKERGTGDVKLLRHTVKNCCRVVMRRDKTYKICANHYITPWMELKPNCGSDRAWVYSVAADYADEQIRSELLAIKFGNAENALKWKETFEEAKNIVNTLCDLYTKNGPSESEGESDSDTAGEDSADEGEKPECDKKAPTELETEVTQELEKLSVAEASGEQKV